MKGAGKGDWTGTVGGRQNRVHPGTSRITEGGGGAAYSPAFQRRFQERLVAGTDFRLFPHVVATMVMIQTGSCLLMSFSIITESYMGRRGEIKLL